MHLQAKSQEDEEGTLYLYPFIVRQDDVLYGLRTVFLRFAPHGPRDQNRSSLRSGCEGATPDAGQSTHNNEADRREVSGEGTEPSRFPVPTGQGRPAAVLDG